MGDCELRAANGINEKHCEGERCMYWRALDHLGTGDGDGCAIQHFELLGNEGVAAWLLTVKERFERAESGS